MTISSAVTDRLNHLRNSYDTNIYINGLSTLELLIEENYNIVMVDCDGFTHS